MITDVNAERSTLAAWGGLRGLLHDLSRPLLFRSCWRRFQPRQHVYDGQLANQLTIPRQYHSKTIHNLLRHEVMAHIPTNAPMKCLWHDVSQLKVHRRYIPRGGSVHFPAAFLRREFARPACWFGAGCACAYVVEVVGDIPAHICARYARDMRTLKSPPPGPELRAFRPSQCSSRSGFSPLREASIRPLPARAQ